MKRTTLEISVVPKSSQRKIVLQNDSVKVYLNSPPVEGKANKECIKILAKKLGIAPSNISIIRGETGRKKVVLIIGLEKVEVMDRLKTIV